MFGQKNKRIPIKKSDYKKAVLDANKRLSNSNKQLESDVKDKQSELKSIKKESSAVKKELNKLNDSFGSLEAEFSTQKALLNSEKGKVSKLKKEVYNVNSNISNLRGQEAAMCENIKMLHKQSDSLKSNIGVLKSQEASMKEIVSEVDYFNKQKEICKNELDEINEAISAGKREIDRIDGDFERRSSGHKRDVRVMSKKHKELDLELVAISKSVEVAEAHHKSLSTRLKEDIQKKEVDLEALKSLINDKEVEYISMKEKAIDAENLIKDEEFRINKIKDNFEKWKVGALESAAKLKLKGKLDNIDKAGLGDILNG